MSDYTYTKIYETRQYTEVIYMRDGEEIDRETLNDDHSFDSELPKPMTEQEIEEWI